MSELMENENGRTDGVGAPAGAWEKPFESSEIECATSAVAETPASHDPSALDAHVAAGHDLIPLRHWQALDAKGKPAGKVPQSAGWRRQPALSQAEAVAGMKAEKNVGVRLRAVDLVIDVDPRNFVDGVDSFDALKAKFDLPEAPFVRTGGGGFHHYFRKPADVAVVGALAAWPGVEFKTLGRQVVAAGSVHPNGTPYGLDDDALALSLSDAPEAPGALLDAIGKPSVDRAATGSGEITPEQLERLLSKLDVNAFNGRHDDWLKIMMAAHHGTDGAGVDEFVAWSVSDPDYFSDEDLIRGRWASLTIKRDGVTLATLLKALSDAGHGAFIEEVLRSPASEDFPDDVQLPADVARPAFLTAKGRIEANYRNTQRAVEAGRFGVGYDELSQRYCLRAERLPWTVDIGRELNDDLIRIVREWIMEQFGFEPKREDVSDVMFALATKNTFNPVVEYLDGLAWDGVPRVDRLFPAYFGSPDGEYERSVGRKLMLAAVRRMRRAGTKFDTVPIIEGRQGSGKTSALRILGGPWHSDAELGRVEGKDAAAALHGVWIMELGELTAMNKAEVDHLKAFVTRTEDRYRPPYGRTVKTYPRRCVFVGTTNSAAYLRDHTGNRRYLPVATGTIDLDALKRDRDQLWAEASWLEAKGETLTLPAHLWSDAAEKQGDRMIDDPWLDRLRAYAEFRPDKTRFLSEELLEQALEVHCSRRNQNDAKRVSMLMAKLGWRHKTNLRDGQRSGTGYVSPLDPTF
jgi:hypothetical protein